MAKVDSSLVADLPLFAGLSTADLDAILSEARSVRVAKNSPVFEQGEEAHSFFVLLHGHVRASKATPAGEQIVVRYVATGETFGVAKAIGLQRYPATATAVDDSVVLAWPSGAWPRLVEKFPALAANTLQTVGARLQDLAGHRPYVAATQDYEDTTYGWALRDTSGVCTLYADPATGKLLGAHILGSQAALLIQPLVQAASTGLSVAEMARGQYWIHPALSEVVENALLKLPL